LEWFTIVFYVNKRWGRWTSMLQDFHFKIIHRLGSKNSNVYALNRNLEFVSKEEEDFLVEILDQITIMESGDRCHDKIKIMKYKVFLLCQK
jgi:hypothetical protein